MVTEGVTPSLNVYYKNTRIQQYHKEGRALRTETTINDAWDFRVGKRRHNLPRLREIGFQANRRLLEVERLTHDCILAEETFRTLNGPVEVNGQRASALRFADPKVQALWHALVLFRVQTQEFRHADLRACWAALTGRNPSEVSQGAIRYQRTRLRLHGMIERAPHTHRYRVTPLGLRAALFCTRSYTRLLRPGLAFSLPGHQAIAMPLKRAFDNFETEIQACIQRANLAA